MPKPADIRSCQKCQGEMRVIGFGGIIFEHCPNCESYFLDREALKAHASSSLDDTPYTGSDPYLDPLPINCLSCGTKMEKEKKKGKGVLLDVCPNCRSVWFDKGEIARCLGNHPEQKKEKLEFKLICEPCNLEISYKQVADNAQKTFSCPRCKSFLGFKERLTEKNKQRLLQDIAVIFGLIFLVLAVYFTAAYFFNSRHQAVTLAGMIFVGGMFALPLLLSKKDDEPTSLWEKRGFDE